MDKISFEWLIIDITERYLYLTTSHDRSGSITAAFTPIRIVCRNTQNASLKNMTNVVRIKHTSGAKQSMEDALNADLIYLYWNVGAYISGRRLSAEWGDKTVRELAKYIADKNPEIKGFSRPGLYKMIQFFDNYKSSKFVSSIAENDSKNHSFANCLITDETISNS